MESSTSSDIERFGKGIPKDLVPMSDVGLATLTSGSNEGLLLQGELSRRQRGMLAPGGAQIGLQGEH